MSGIATDCSSTASPVYACGSEDTPPASVGSRMYVKLINGKCSEENRTVAASGSSTETLTNNADSSVAVNSSVVWNNSVKSIPTGNYCMWVFLDPNDDGVMVASDPVAKYDKSFNSPEIGALIATQDWRDSTSSDRAIYNNE